MVVGLRAIKLEGQVRVVEWLGLVGIGLYYLNSDQLIRLVLEFNY